MTIRILSVVAVSLFGMALISEFARAEQPVGTDEMPPMNRPVSSPIVLSALTIADRYWRMRGIVLEPRVEVYRVAGDYPRGDLGGYRVWIRDAELDGVRTGTPGQKLYWRAEFCATLIHERGHNAGLPHAESGVMAADYESYTGPPPLCASWAERWPWIYAQ